MNTKRNIWLRVFAPIMATLPASGCLGGDARVEIAAANLLDVASDSLATALVEYHNEILAADVRREEEAILAFANRVTANRNHPDDPDRQKAIDQDTRQFAEALAKLRADTRTEWDRHITLMRNLKTLQDVATTLRQLAVESLSLEDDTKRYLSDALIQLKEHRAREMADATLADE